MRGKRLSAMLRDGVLLCAAYQSSEYAAKGDSYTNRRHRCAVLLQSGCICGGTHRTSEYRMKRAIHRPARAPEPKRLQWSYVQGQGQARSESHTEAQKDARDAQLPPLTLREPEMPPPGHVVLVEPDLSRGRGAEIPSRAPLPKADLESLRRQI